VVTLEHAATEPGPKPASPPNPWGGVETSEGADVGGEGCAPETCRGVDLAVTTRIFGGPGCAPSMLARCSSNMCAAADVSPGFNQLVRGSWMCRKEKGRGIRLRKFVLSHFTGREGGMTTVWRPRVRIAVPDIDGADADENRRDESTKKGTKRKRAPPTKGPCEHGVKQRSNCKVCSACPHGRQRCRCKECGGASICEHGRQRRICKECGGSQICEHGRERSRCKECGGSQICEHGRRRSECKECGGSSICEHGRQRSKCKECGGASICDHGHQRYRCKECGGRGICEHGHQRYRCKECHAAKQ
jgi:hypothetical protein